MTRIAPPTGPVSQADGLPRTGGGIERTGGMTDEEYVRSVWASATESVYEPHEGYSIPQTQITFGSHRVTEIKKSKAWAKAAEYTRNRMEEIRQLREEIEWIQDCVDMSGIVEPEQRRILSRLESELSRLQTGMKVQP